MPIFALAKLTKGIVAAVCEIRLITCWETMDDLTAVFAGDGSTLLRSNAQIGHFVGVVTGGLQHECCGAGGFIVQKAIGAIPNVLESTIRSENK